MEPHGCRRSCRSGLESLPSYLLIHDILLKLDLPSLCSLSCVSSCLRSAASQALSLLPSLDISEVSVDVHTVNLVLSRSRCFDTLTLNCLRLDEPSIHGILRPHIRELNLIRGALLSHRVLSSVAQKCPDLRVLVVEMAENDSHLALVENLVPLLAGCVALESLCIKIRGTEGFKSAFQGINMFWPKSVKSLKLKPLLCSEALDIVRGLSSCESMDVSGNLFFRSSPSALQKLSLFLDVISDELVITITRELPHLVELDLEDMPMGKPLISHDLTDVGLQSMGSCCRLKSLSLARSRQQCPVSFRRVSDMGIFLLSEGCRGLESIRLTGFCKVSDAGFTSILQSCHSLKKFEIRNATLLSDLAFHDLTEAPCSLSELRLRTCNLITSESMKKLACYSSLELLDLGGCWSIADPGIPSISSLCRLTTLDLAGADITDVALSALGQGTSPIKSLSLRGCKRVTDRGISHLLQSGGIVSSTLSTLDLGHMPGISDLAISTIIASRVGITELCIRSCFYVTDSSIEALSKRGGSLLRKLDLYSCIGLSHSSLGCFARPSFRGLWWLGVGATRLSSGKSDFSEVCRERPWFTVCTYGCEMGCHDGWQFHQTAPQSPWQETGHGEQVNQTFDLI